MDTPQKYRESSPGLRREFTLYPEKLVIVGRDIEGKEFKTHTPPRGVSPESGYIRFQSPRFAQGFMLFVGHSVCLWLFLGPFQLPLLSVRVVLTAALALLSLGFALYYWPEYKAYLFVNSSGVNAVQIIEAGPGKVHCQAFVDQIARAIEDLGSTNA
jgi:hypothetical protein